MTKPAKETIPDLLVKNIPRDLIMGIEEALEIGAQRAYTASLGMDDGHLSSVVGQLRHFNMNESFQRALTISGAEPSPIRGNSIVTGQAGMLKLARFNIKDGIWLNGRRSHIRRQMALANKAIESLVQPDLFADNGSPSEAVVFFVACFSGSLTINPESPISIQIAVPDQHMHAWLFRESINDFVKRYDDKPVSQQGDLAIPKLKKNIGTQVKNGTTQ